MFDCSQESGKRIRPWQRLRADQIVARIGREVTALRSLTEHQLRTQMRVLRDRCEPRQLAAPQQIIPVFALMAEAVRRTLRIELFDVQFLAGIALARKSIAEMQTGEGKTFATALPACAHALLGRGVHVMTANAYLARRDYDLLRPAYELLGFSVGLLAPGESPAQKRAAYACDITLGPGYEFGFDFLRDQVSLWKQQRHSLGHAYRQQMRGGVASSDAMIQRGHHLAIVDEADSVMIDEATTPLVLADCAPPSASDGGVYRAAMTIADLLQQGRDYVLDESASTLHLTARGLEAIRAQSRTTAREPLQRRWRDYVDQSLRAKYMVQEDVDYIIANDTVCLVDTDTGRVFSDRSWRDGLRQAVELRAGVPITSETEAVARISRQRYLRLYDGLCGLTGTAVDSEQEFRRIYGLPVIPIPVRLASRRTVQRTRCFATRQAKWSAIVAAIAAVHQTGRPVLVGTRTIQDSQRLAAALRDVRIPHRVLNGKNDTDEAALIARAGAPHAITVATNMAGRGTDIRLAPGIAALGGLHVIGCERHDSHRVDRQLMGRCARQGDPGSCQFFLAADDHLMTSHAPLWARSLQRRAQHDGEVIDNLEREIRALQRRVERQQFATRRRLLEQDRWMEELLERMPPVC